MTVCKIFSYALHLVWVLGYEMFTSEDLNLSFEAGPSYVSTNFYDRAYKYFHRPIITDGVVTEDSNRVSLEKIRSGYCCTLVCKL